MIHRQFLFTATYRLYLFYEVCLKAFSNVIYALRKVNRYKSANDISNVSLTISLYLLMSKIQVTLSQDFFFKFFTNSKLFHLVELV